MQGWSVLFAILAIASAVCPHQQTDLIAWSTWSGKPSSASDNVTIAVGQKVLLDVSPEFVVNQINVFGELVFANVDLELKVRYIWVYEGGHLWIGSEECEITAKVTVSLYGNTQTPKTDPPLQNSNKVIGVFSGGIVDIHGVVRSPTWTVLDEFAAPGQTSITLATTVNWQPGDVIVIATTDYTHRDDSSITTANDPSNEGNDYWTDERRTIIAVSTVGDRSIVTFDKPLEYVHYGKIWTSSLDPTARIDMRAEVGLLSRNIVIRGDISEGTSGADHWGGHIMAVNDCSMRIKGAEFYYMGQKDNLARYPVHYHLCSTTTSSYVKENAFHDTFQRAVTLHGSNGILVKDNVAFNISGHCYFVEDGFEVENVFEHNLGIRSNPHTLLKSADATPAIFWTTNPNNKYVDNVAVGGHFGYWYAMPKHPLGLSTVPNYMWWPRHTALGVFKGNKAHSCTRKGLHFDDGLVTAEGKTELSAYRPVDWQKFITNEQALVLSQIGSGWTENALEEAMYTLPRAEGVVEDFVAYKCIEHGIWGRGSFIRVKRAILADNQIGAQFPGDGNILEDSIIIGETDNAGNPKNLEYEQGWGRFYRWYPHATIVGYQHYDGGSPDIVRNTKFFNFKDFEFPYSGRVRHAGAIRLMGGRFVIPPRNKYYNVGFFNAPNHVYLEPANNENIYRGYEPNLVSAVVVDADGSLTGVCGSSIVYGNNSMLYTSACQNYSNWNAMVCPPGHKPHRTLVIRDKGPQKVYTGYGDEVFDDSALYMHRLPDHATHLIPSQVSASPEDYYQFTAVVRDSYSTNILVNTAYVVKFGKAGNTPSKIEISLEPVAKGEFVKIGFSYPIGTTFSIVYGENDFTQVNSMAELGYLNYFHDQTTKILWVHMENKREWFRYDYGHVSFSSTTYLTLTATCPNSNCDQDIDLSTVTAPEYSATGRNVLCEKGGSIYGGFPKFTPNGGSEWIVFDESLNEEWSFASWETNSRVTTERASSGVSGIRIDFAQNGFSVYRVNKQKTYPADVYTHFCFKTRSLDGRGEYTLGIQFGDKNDENLSRDYYTVETVNHPGYLNSGPIDDSQWHEVCIPLADLGLGSGQGLYNDIYRFYMWCNYQRYNTTVYIDEIKFGSYDVSVESDVTLSSNLMDTAYNYYKDPYNTPKPVEPEWWETAGSGAGQTPISASSSQDAAAAAAAAATAAWAVPVVIVLALVIVGLIVAVVVLFKRAQSEHF
eukprot:TRINITY_DN11974_c0_g1_i1.p1 TRINITY_DN11974_c0_g1~~TRINITY_DN11974_c0_g1_i1.p1  ORF type:complete len:1221 (-),score=309.90 TRINITY_DN11974_c0_g1_i1:103-3765(-)